MADWDWSEVGGIAGGLGSAASAYAGLKARDMRRVRADQVHGTIEGVFGVSERDCGRRDSGRDTGEGDMWMKCPGLR